MTSLGGEFVDGETPWWRDELIGLWSPRSFATSELTTKKSHPATKKSRLAANSPPRSSCSIRECLNYFFRTKFEHGSRIFPSFI